MTTERVAVVTDSTSCLPAATLERLRIGVVPLRVTLGHRTAVDDGVDVTSAQVTRALRDRQVVRTSRPTPAEFAAAFRAQLEAGAARVVSVHLSAALSGTWESATLAAQDFPHGVVRVVDSRSTAMGLGFAVIAAAECARDGGSAAEVQGAATASVDGTRTMFYVDTLEHLRRGGRIGTAATLFATSLSIKPLLQMVEGQIVPLEKVRTSSRALARLVELTIAAAGTGPVDLAVHHLAAADKATALEAQLRSAIPGVRQTYVAELGAVIGAHLGPGVLGTVLVRR
ncbi:MAG TPA: DegV family protein [Jatrophihabitans sp.]|jgi:DegV family protein with EDD domain|uniref:DegV family protein n=1 Tax=Jatrophihabitans sp. TaxID=1932789 RepID=UPI002E079416|nr:DegV family protein [Jatrophihabitans sp.]